MKRAAALCTLLLTFASCAIELQPPASVRRLSAKHLTNAIRLHAKVISGGQPQGNAGFAELKSLGVRTIISVDGAQPDVVAAKKYGLRYVHLPHGYDRISDERVRELAKAVRDLPGPIYVHCHHGRHRSPAAATIACIGAGLLEPSTAKSVLRFAGTSASYQGLYQSAQRAERFEATLLDQLSVEFPEIARLPELAQAMVAMEHTYDRLQQIERSAWQTPAATPDLTHAHEALLLREHYTELLRLADTKSRPATYRRLLHDGEGAAERLRELTEQSANSADLSRQLAVVTKNCADCHRHFRDVPLSTIPQDKR